MKRKLLLMLAGVFVGISLFSTALDTASASPTPDPDGLKAEVISWDSVRLSWNDTAADQGYRIERKETIARGLYFLGVTSVPANATSVIIDGLQPSTAYIFRVRTLSREGYGSYGAVFPEVTTLPAPAPPEGTLGVNVNGLQVVFPDQQPITDDNGRVLVPISFPMKAMEVNVQWNEADQTLTLEKNGVVAMFAPGSTLYYVDGEKHTMDTAAQNINGRNMFPVRYAAEAFGASVNWNAADQSVDIWYQDIISETGAYNWILYKENGSTLTIVEAMGVWNKDFYFKLIVPGDHPEYQLYTWQHPGAGRDSGKSAAGDDSSLKRPNPGTRYYDVTSDYFEDGRNILLLDQVPAGTAMTWEVYEMINGEKTLVDTISFMIDTR